MLALCFHRYLMSRKAPTGEGGKAKDLELQVHTTGLNPIMTWGFTSQTDYEAKIIGLLLYFLPHLPAGRGFTPA